MKLVRTLSLAAILASATSAFAAGKTYQVTGPVLEVNDKTIVVQKGKEKWELQRDAATKGAADVKVGDKVTIEYTMTAVSVENKGGGKAAPADKAAAKPAK
jgi:hypothetical protein